MEETTQHIAESNKLSNDLRNFSNDDSIEKKQYKIGFIGAISIIIGVIIGSGIFATPTIVIKMTGSIGMALFIWFISGVMSFAMALTYAELGTMFPKSGGVYIYIKECYGDVIAFCFSLVNNLVLTPAARGLSCLIISEYIIKSVAGNMCDKLTENHSIKLLSILILGLLTAVNIWSTKLAARVQVVSTILKLLAVFILIVTGFYTLIDGKTENFKNPFEGTTTSITRIAYALNGGLWAYGGWATLNMVIGEVKKPNRTLPWAVMVSMTLITTVYLLVNIAYTSALTKEEIESSNAVALVNLSIAIVSLLGCTFQVVAPFKDNPLESFCCLLIFFVGVPIYYVIYIYKLPNCIVKANDEFTRIVQLMFNVDFDHTNKKDTLLSK